jgi:acyl carrier protein|tara:strand:- start:609 stop:827 length:219 start_codon:yes stop_codon:yes gene_type:complete
MDTKEVIAKQLGLGVEQLKDEANFMSDLGTDSLEIVELIMVLEDEFEIDIPDEDAEKLLAVGDVVNYINDNG